jgi:hypothetical protein
MIDVYVVYQDHTRVQHVQVLTAIRAYYNVASYGRLTGTVL